MICYIKADGYRHIMVQTVAFLADVCGADAFGVATLEEAIALRRALNSRFTITVVKLAAAGGEAGFTLERGLIWRYLIPSHPYFGPRTSCGRFFWQTTTLEWGTGCRA